MKADKCECSGCRACENICPQKCIKINEAGKKRFIRIKGGACKECGLCDMVCPHKNNECISSPILGMNAWIKNRRLLRKASSGGIATAIYQCCLQNGFECIGVSFDEEFNLNYTFITSLNQLNEVVGSKYVYSNMNDMYKRIEKELQFGKQVIFVGLPCHVSALKNYCKLKKITIEGLYCVDIVCHGVMMPKLFLEHVSYLKKIYKIDNNTRLSFREKNNQYGISVFNKGHDRIDISPNDDAYMWMYIQGMYAQACFNCSYAQKKRAGDITIKDCCTPYNARKMKSPDSQSSVLINTEKGISLWNKLRDVLECYDYPTEAIINEDSMLSHPTPKPREYTLIMLLEKSFGYRYAVKIIWGAKMIYRKYIKRV